MIETVGYFCWLFVGGNPMGSIYIYICTYIYHEIQLNVGKYIPYMDGIGMVQKGQVGSPMFFHPSKN